jgi:DNA modification methylase
MFLKEYFKQINAPQGNGERSAHESYNPSVPPIKQYVNKVFNGDCTQVMRHFPAQSVDLVVTDPPYLVNFQGRTGRSYRNDDPNNPWWVAPSFTEMYRVLKPNSFCVSFIGAFNAEIFLTAWKAVGFRPVGFFPFLKEYPSSQGYIKWHSEHAYLLTKGNPRANEILPNVLPFYYSGNEAHPSEKPPETLKPLIHVFSKESNIVLDSFCNSGSTLVAARDLKRRYIGIELDRNHAQTAADRAYERTAQTYSERL